MIVRQLAELAGTLSVHALQIVESPFPDSAESLERLRDSSNKRTEAWSMRMQDLETAANCWPGLYRAGDAKSPLIEEILVSEMLARVVGAILIGQAEHSGETRIRRTASELFLDAQKARRMVLGKMLEMADDRNPSVQKLDRLRRSAERWTDILLGPLAGRFRVRHLIFEPRRSEEFGQAILPHLATGTAGKMIAAGIRVGFPETILGVPAHAGLHRDMAAAVLAWLPSDLFHFDGPMRSLRSVRASRSLKASESPPPDSRGRRPFPPPAESENLPQSKISYQDLRRRRPNP